MAAEWARATLGEVVDFISGGTPSKSRSDYWGGSIPWVSAKDMKRFRIEDTEDHVTQGGLENGTKLVPADTVLLLARGMTLIKDVPICVARRPVTFNQDVKALRPKPGVRPEFLPYLLLGNKRRLMSLVDLAGHGTGRLNSDELKALGVRLPPTDEQRSIAHILGTLDDKIELNLRMSGTLEAIARAIFQSWFVDFDPVRAKMEGRWKKGQSLPGLPAYLYDLFPDRLVPSELSEIPKGWEVRPFGELLSDSIGGDWGTEAPAEVSHAPIAVIRGTDLSDLRSGGVGNVPVRYTTSRKLERRRLQDGDIVIEVSGGSPTQPTGRSLLITKSILDRFAIDVVCASFCRRFRPETTGAGILVSQHLAWLYETGGTWQYQNQSTGIANFQTSRFLESELVVWPNEGVLGEYVRVVEPMIERRYQNETLALETLRDTLLPKLTSGELRVKDAERFLEGAVA